VAKIQADRKRCKELLEKSTAYSTLFTPVLGYDAVSAAVKESLKTGKTFREVILEQKLLTKEQFEKVIKEFSK
jgi:aspartate ammonia-lyase